MLRKVHSIPSGFSCSPLQNSKNMVRNRDTFHICRHSPPYLKLSAAGDSRICQEDTYRRQAQDGRGVYRVGALIVAGLLPQQHRPAAPHLPCRSSHRSWRQVLVGHEALPSHAAVRCQPGITGSFVVRFCSCNYQCQQPFCNNLFLFF